MIATDERTTGTHVPAAAEVRPDAATVAPGGSTGAPASRRARWPHSRTRASRCPCSAAERCGT